MDKRGSKMSKEMHLTALVYSTGLHPDSWRLPNSHVEEIGRIDFQIRMAKLAERGKLDAFFLGDGQYISEEGTGQISYYFEPITALAAIAQETNYIGLVSTISSSFYEPYLAARMLSSLNQISQGRIGANIVTSQFDVEAQNYSMDKLPPLEERYRRADEFITVMKKLWGSFNTSAIINDKANGVGLDSSQIKPINHKGKYFQVDGAINIPTPEYDRPMLFQAGTSIPGRDIAVRHVEGIFSIAWNMKDAQDFREDIHLRSAKEQRNSPLVLPGLTVYVDESYDKAHALKQELDQFVSLESRKKRLSKAIGIDVADWQLEDKVPDLPAYEEVQHKVVKSVYNAVRSAVETEALTLRQLLERFSTWVGRKTIVGTPDMVADEMIKWFEGGACDGFTLMPPTYPNLFEKFINLVIPILQERGYFRKDYDHATLQGHLGLSELKI
jgi:FMN-dependent oxidoreductase (nitrilotriacetate monooxygenase family)